MRNAANPSSRPRGNRLGALLAAGALLLPVLLNAQEAQVPTPIQEAPVEITEMPAPSQLPLPVEEVRIFTEAFDAIRSAYVEEVDDKTLLGFAIKGMLAGLDPHSAYLSEEDFDSLTESTQGEFGGLGIEVGEENGYIKVITPIDDTPASRAGIEPGDLIVEIDGRPLRELPVNEAEICTFGKKKALVIERFDRRWTKDGRLLRLPQEDCSAPYNS